MNIQLLNPLLLRFLIACTGVFVLTQLGGQEVINPPSSRAELDSLYQANILKSRINGVYIPKDLEDAFEEFVHLSPEDAIASFKAADEDMVEEKLHFGIGRWMIVNWNFYEGSRLSHYLRELGVMHPDDMAGFLIRYFHRKLNGKDPDIKALAEHYAELRKKDLNKKGKIHFN